MAAAKQVKVYEVLAARESPFWLLTVPDLGLVSQARWWGEAESMARDVIATHLDVSVEEVAVDIHKSSEPAGPRAGWWTHLTVWAEAARARITGR